jgi:hypothetical protein
MYRNLEVLSGDISIIGLTPDDIRNRGLVAVGYCEDELLPPYTSWSGRAHRRRAKQIIDFIGENPQTLTIADMGGINNLHPAPFPDTKVVQVVGGYAGLCVGMAVEVLISQGLFAYIDSRLTFGMKSRDDVALGKLVMEGITPCKGRKVLAINDTEFIYLQR